MFRFLEALYDMFWSFFNGAFGSWFPYYFPSGVRSLTSWIRRVF